jgi:hypothetical protein
MKTIVMCAVAAVAAVGCGDGGGGGSFSATVTLTDGTTFRLDQRCLVSNEINNWAIEGYDQERVFGAIATWDRSVVAQPGMFSADDLADSVLMFIVREHPTDPSMVRLSSVNSGSIVFTEIGYDSGDRIAGTFDDVQMMRDDPDDMVMIRLDDGAFECEVP